MVYKLVCECQDRTAIVVDSLVLFKELLAFFEKEVQNRIFIKEVPSKPYYVWKSQNIEKKWFATSWYKCNMCGCLWEFNYPDFPATGFIRKFPDGIYKERGY